MSLFDSRSTYLYNHATLVPHPDGNWLVIPVQRGNYFAFGAFDPDGQELGDYPNVYQSMEGAIAVGKQFVAYTMARLKAGEWRV
jgi:hypothetical protein